MKLPIFILLLCTTCLGANKFVRPASAGSNNGSSWNNAWSLASLDWSALSAGDTVYFAGGNYITGVNTVNSSGVFENPIKFVRALGIDGISALSSGWNTSFDSQVVFNQTGQSVFWWRPGVTDKGDYLTFDGKIINGMSFHVGDSNGVFGAFQVGTPCSGVILTNLEIVGPGDSSAYPYSNGIAGIYINPTTGATTNLLISNCSIHGISSAIYLIGCQSPSIEHCVFYDIVNTAPPNQANQHGNIIWTGQVTNGSFRFNESWNWDTEGILLTSTSSNPHGRWDIYANLFHDPYQGTNGVGRVLECQVGVNGPVLFYNNSLSQIYVPVHATAGGSWATGTKSRNNIYHSFVGIYNDMGDMDYDFVSGGSAETHGVTGNFPFISSIDFRPAPLSVIIQKGVTLGVQYNIDTVSNIRINNWTIGAYEYPHSIANITTINVGTLSNK